MQLQNSLRAICSALDADVLMALVTGSPSTPGTLVRTHGVRASISGVRRCLERLEKNGIVDSERLGNQTRYSLNRQHMLADLILEAPKAIDLFARFLKSRISMWNEQPLQVTLFGSAARHEMHADSDIDVLFIAPNNAADEIYEEISELAIEAYRFTGNDVRPLVYEESEIQPAPIFDSIMREGVHIFGDKRWLSRQLQSRTAAADEKYTRT